MTLKTFESKLLLRVALLFVLLCALAWLLASRQWIYAFLLFPLTAYQLLELVRFQRKALAEINQFVEAVHYRDFSRHFDVQHAPFELQSLRKGFNEINSAFKIISREKETQYHYLQKILEIVNTGILSYAEETGEVIWLNEALKQMLQIPYLKTIHSLEKRDPLLYGELLTLRPGESRVAAAHLERETFKILLSVTAFQIEGKKYRLIAFQNVHEALDETESKAWQKLLSVMTHEIMNSVAPISSLAATLKKRLQVAVSNPADAATFEDLELGIETIKRRSDGLLQFADTYRSLNKINTLQLQQVKWSELLANLHQLMQPTLAQKSIELEIILKDPKLVMQVDRSLMEQVFINLLVNAIEAVKETEEPKIVISAEQTTAGKILLKVADNGHGMPHELMERIFIPFFSTKNGGSGIGLSLCKQIIMLHRATINVQSAEGKGTVFTMQFG